MVLARTAVLTAALMCSAGLAACGDVTSPAAAPAPAPAVLTAQTRAQLAPVLDLNAAEQFFRTMSQRDADRVLTDMGFVVDHPPAETRRVLVPVRSTNPAIQRLLDQMLAPYRKTLPNGGADDPAQSYLGRPHAQAAQVEAERGHP